MSTLRPLILSALASVVAGLVFASVMGGPASIAFIVLGPLMIGVTFLDRVVEKRAAARDALASIDQERLAQPAPDQRLAGDRRTPDSSVPHGLVTWWNLGLPSPSQRRVRLGERTVAGRDVVPWGGHRRVSQLVAVDLEGGLKITGPEKIAQAVELALRVNRGFAYSPHEQSPVIAFGHVSSSDPPLRWSLDVDSFGRGRLFDRLSADAHPVLFDVDMLDSSAGARLVELESAAAECRVADLRLERDSAHALVSGMTGSGKTEFLIAWLWEFARAATPDELAIAVIDFKGGGSFARLRALPHLRHIASDIEPDSLEVALAGLRSQMLQRERLMAQFAVPDIARVPRASRPPRCVLVIDEYHALIERFPEFRTLLSDIAARGRALGIHLIVSTQRFSTLSRDSLLANIQTRVVFRASDPSESKLLLGVTDASVTKLAPGHALVVGADGQTRRLEVSMVGDNEPGPGLVAVYRPLWLEPGVGEALTTSSRNRALREGAHILGTIDDHETLRRINVEWMPQSDGVLLCVGRSHHTRRNVLMNVCAPSDGVIIVPDEPAHAWDVIDEVRHGSPARSRGFIITDIDSLVSRTPAQWREECIEMVVDTAHQQSRRGLPVALGFVGEGSLLARLQQLISTTVKLSEDGRTGQCTGQEFKIAGPIEVLSTATEDLEEIPELTFGRASVGQSKYEQPALVITSSPHRWSFEVQAGHAIAVTPHEYLMSPRPLLSTQRLVIDGCSPAEIRSLRVTEHPLPPPLTGTVFELDEMRRFRRLTTVRLTAENTASER